MGGICQTTCCTSPFKTVHNVIEYLGRYTHRIAISNHRFISIDKGRVRFWAKNYRKEGKREVVDLAAKEFLRRFCMHILPHKFRKIRHYGFLSNGCKKRYLKQIRSSLNVQAPEIKNRDITTILREKYGVERDSCPHCKKGKMVQVRELKRGEKFYPLE